MRVLKKHETDAIFEQLEACCRRRYLPRQARRAAGLLALQRHDCASR
jgi:hypothetical protein